MSSSLKIGLGIHYSYTLIKNGSGAHIRNQYIFANILSMLRERNILIKILEKPIIKPNLFNFIGFATTKILARYFKSVEPIHYVFYEKSYKKITTKDYDIVFFYHIYDSLIYARSNKKAISVIEMPENIVETAGYLSRWKIGTELLKTITVESLNQADIITAPTMRDALKYREYGIRSQIIIIPNVIPIPMKIYDIINLNKQKLHSNNINIIIESWGSFREKLELATKLIKFLPRNAIIHITRGPERINIRNKLFVHKYLTRKEWLKLLCQSHIFIFYPKIPWTGGHSVRLNDAALCGNIIFGSEYDLRGEPYPYQYSYVDIDDLITKIIYLIENYNEMINMSLSNQNKAIERYQIGRNMLKKLSKIIINNF